VVHRGAEISTVIGRCVDGGTDNPWPGSVSSGKAVDATPFGSSVRIEKEQELTTCDLCAMVGCCCETNVVVRLNEFNNRVFMQQHLETLRRGTVVDDDDLRNTALVLH